MDSFTDLPVFERNVQRVVDEKPCGAHSKPVGVPCYAFGAIRGGLVQAVCNKRAKKLFDNPIRPESLRKK